MKRRLIRLASAVLSVAMLFSLAACGGSSDNATNTPTNTPAAGGDNGSDNGSTTEKLDPLPFTIFVGGNDPGTFNEDESHKYLTEKIGLDVKLQYTTGTDTETQVNLMLAGGDYPDAIGMKYGKEVRAFVEGNHLLDLTDWYPKYVPSLTAMMESNDRLFKWDIPGFNEQIWFVPTQIQPKEYPGIVPTVGMRYDLWRKLADDPKDLPRPKDMEEFYELTKKLQDMQPEYEGKKAYGISGWLGDSWGGQWLVWSITSIGGSNTWIGTANQSDDWQRKYCFDSDTWMYAMRYINRAYREGYADPEAVTMNQEAYNKKLAQGIVYTTPYSGVWMDGKANTARAAAGHPEEKIVPYTWMSYPASAGVKDGSVSGGADPKGFSKFMITKNCKDAEEVFKRLSWLATEEGQVFQGMGVEGIHWDYDDEGFRKPKDEIIEMFMNDPDFIHKTGVGKYAYFANYYSGLDSNHDAYNLLDNKYTQARQEDQYDLEYKEILGLDPNLTVEANAARAGNVISEGEWLVTDLGVAGTEFQEIEDQINVMEAEYIGKLYMAKNDAEFDKLIEEWKVKCQNINYMDYYNQINPIVQKDYQDFLARQK